MPIQYLWLIPLGVIIGAFGTFIGAGGGFVLVPLLLILYPDAQPETITSISLVVVFFNALSGSWAYARMKRIHYRAGVLFSLAAIPGAVLGALTTYYVPRRAFDVVCGIFMLATAAYLMMRSPKSSQALPPIENSSPNDVQFSTSLGAAISAVLGYISSLLGIGGGIIQVPALVHFLNFRVRHATATSQFILAITAFTGSAVHVASGTFHEGIRRTICLSIGVIIGAQIGAAFSKWLHGVFIIRCLAVALALVSLRVLLLAL